MWKASDDRLFAIAWCLLAVGVLMVACEAGEERTVWHRMDGIVEIVDENGNPVPLDSLRSYDEWMADTVSVQLPRRDMQLIAQVLSLLVYEKKWSKRVDEFEVLSEALFTAALKEETP